MSQPSHENTPGSLLIFGRQRFNQSVIIGIGFFVGVGKLHLSGKDS